MLTKTEILKKASTSHKLQARLKNIYHAWPNLKEATLKFLDYTHPDIVDNETGKSLLSKCLNNACEEFDNCPINEVGSTEQVYLFLNGLLSESHKILDYHVTTENMDIWDPLNESVLKFLNEHSNIKLVEEPYVKTKPETIRMMILARIITMKDLKAIPANKIKGIINHADLVTH